MTYCKHVIDGKKVVDADYKMALVIEPQDIKKGVGREPASCAAAVACVRQMEALSAHVYLSRVYVEFPKRWLRFRTPAALRTEIISFDRGRSFTPGTYYLSPLCPSERPNGRRKGSNGNGSRPKRKRAPSHKLEGVREMSDMHHKFIYERE